MLVALDAAGRWRSAVSRSLPPSARCRLRVLRPSGATTPVTLDRGLSLARDAAVSHVRSRSDDHILRGIDQTGHAETMCTRGQTARINESGSLAVVEIMMFGTNIGLVGISQRRANVAAPRSVNRHHRDEHWLSANGLDASSEAATLRAGFACLWHPVPQDVMLRCTHVLMTLPCSSPANARSPSLSSRCRGACIRGPAVL